MANGGAKDYKQQKLCGPCWDGKHNHCEHGTCECCCAALKANKAALSAKLRASKPEKARVPIDWNGHLEDWERIHGTRQEEPTTA